MIIPQTLSFTIIRIFYRSRWQRISRYYALFENLRDPRSKIQEKSEEQLRILKQEAVFYRLNDMVKQLDQLNINDSDECFSVEMLIEAFNTLQAREYGRINFPKSKKSIIASYKHLQNNNQYGNSNKIGNLNLNTANQSF